MVTVSNAFCLLLVLTTSPSSSLQTQFVARVTILILLQLLLLFDISGAAHSEKVKPVSVKHSITISTVCSHELQQVYTAARLTYYCMGLYNIVTDYKINVQLLHLSVNAIIILDFKY